MTRKASRVLVLAPICRDTVIRGGSRRTRAGGSGLFAAWALARLGAEVRLHASLAEGDRDLALALPRDHVVLTVHATRETTHFEIEIDPADPDARRIRLRAASDPIDAARIDPEGCGYVLVAPLLPSDLDAGVLRFLEGCEREVDLGVQGLCRRFAAGGVLSIAAPEAIVALPRFRIIAGDEREIASIPSPMRNRAGEIVTTSGARGARISLSGPPPREIEIPAFRTTRPGREAIGLGDTFLAVYGWWRWKGITPEEAGERAARAAATLLEEGLPGSE